MRLGMQYFLTIVFGAALTWLPVQSVAAEDSKAFSIPTAPEQASVALASKPASDSIAVRANNMDDGVLILARQTLRIAMSHFQLNLIFGANALKNPPVIMGVSQIRIINTNYDSSRRILQVHWEAFGVPAKVFSGSLPITHDGAVAYDFMTKTEWKATYQMVSAPDGESRSDWKINSLEFRPLYGKETGEWTQRLNLASNNVYNDFIQNVRHNLPDRRFDAISSAFKGGINENDTIGQLYYASEVGLYNRIGTALWRSGFHTDLRDYQWITGQMQKNVSHNFGVPPSSIFSQNEETPFRSKAMYWEVIVRDSTIRYSPEHNEANGSQPFLGWIPDYSSPVNSESTTKGKVAESMNGAGLRFIFFNVEPIIENGAFKSIAWQGEYAGGASQLVWIEPVFPFELVERSPDRP